MQFDWNRDVFADDDLVITQPGIADDLSNVGVNLRTTKRFDDHAIGLRARIQFVFVGFVGIKQQGATSG